MIFIAEAESREPTAEERSAAYRELEQRRFIELTAIRAQLDRERRAQEEGTQAILRSLAPLSASKPKRRGISRVAPRDLDELSERIPPHLFPYIDTEWIY